MMNDMIYELECHARQLRGKVIEMSYKSKTPHIGSSLSSIDILTVLYWKILSINPKNTSETNRDRFILSKGHAATALYVTLAQKEFFPSDLLDTFACEGGVLEEHPGPSCVPGVEAATGSLGHGLSIGIGMALSGRIQKQSYRVFVLLSDGECNEGSVWESAMFAAAHKLENVITIIDFNKWQATGRSCEVMALEPLKEKWQSFGWSAYEVDGHSMNELIDVLSNIPDGSEKPIAIVAHTVKGKGVSFMEDDNNWHYRIPNDNELQLAKQELGLI